MNAVTRLLSSVVALLVCLVPATAQQNKYTWQEENCPRQFNVSGVFHVPDAAAKAQVVLNYTDEENYFAITFRDRELAAMQVVRGKGAPLWPARKLPSGSDFAFVIKVRKDRLTTVVNGNLTGIAALKTRSVGGRVGTSVVGSATVEQLRVQEVEPVYFTDDFMRTEEESGEWKTVSGQWRTKSIETVNPDPVRSANPFSYYSVAAGKSITVAGRWFWDSYLYRVSVKPEAPGAVGLVLYYQDPRNYLAFRWWSADSSHTGRARQLLYVREGVEHVESATGSGYQAKQWYRFTVKATDTQLRGFVDGEQAFAVESPPFCGGKIGLYAEQCTGAAFDDVLCTHWDSPADDPSPCLDAPRITPQFAKEDTMKAWANPDYDWQQGEDNWWWNRGEFWGDAALAGDLPNPEGVTATAAFTLHAVKGKPNSGYTLSTESSADGSALVYSLARQGTSIGKGKVAVGGWPVKVEVRRHEKMLLASVAGDCVLSYVDSHPLSGTGSALRTTGKRLPTQQIQAMGACYLDDTFSSAPVNWWQGKGKWEVTNRWQCSPDWSWIGGWKSVAPTLWTKRAIGGDFTLEAYVCNKMEQDGPMGYTHPGDLNVTVCADGRDLGSGYSFIYAGWNNTASGMFRKGEECVPRNAKAFLRNANSRNMGFHRKWFVVRVERRGNRLRHWVDDELISEFTDPSPIPSGRIALWTIGNDQFTNGLVIARARLWYEHEAEAQPFPPNRILTEAGDPWNDRRAPVAPDASSVKHDFATSTHGWSGYGRPDGAIVSLDTTTAASGNSSLRIENAGTGGDLTVWSGVGPFDGLKLDKLRFTYRIPAEVKVNLFLQVEGRYYAFEFTGGPQPPETCPSLGKIEKVQADNQWRRAEVDLGSALRRALPNRNSLQVDRICFSAPLVTYYRAGIGGNGWGTKWNLDDFELTNSK